MKKILGLTAVLVMFVTFAVLTEKITFARVTSSADDRDVWCVGVSGAEVCVDSSGNFIPTTDDNVDLGTSSLQFKNIYIDGTAYVDAISNEGATTGTTAAFSGTLSASSSTFTGGLLMSARTIAQLDALTPTATYQMYVCSDCIVDNINTALVISTGVGKGAFVYVSSTNVHAGDLTAQ